MKKYFLKIRTFFLFLLINLSSLISYSQPIIKPNSNKEITIDSNSITVHWETFLPGNSRVDYGKTTYYELGFIEDGTLTTKHTLKIQNLKPATIYHLLYSSTDSRGTSSTSDWVVSTASSNSSGIINAYFNKSIYPDISTGEIANGESDFLALLINRIDSAKYSIDFCVYSFSGTPGVGDDLANALINARNRGVKIRFIIESDNQETAPVRKLRGAGISILTDQNQESLQHNKFFIFDARDTLSDKDDWIITGSWNATNPGTYNDNQNIIAIQDQALARAFTEEFNEMWGSSDDIPDASKAKFGKNKTNNTPHRFNIKGTSIELYFSPSDGVSTQIQNNVLNAQSSCFFAEMSFTSTYIANAMYQRYTSKKIKVKGLINKDNLNDNGCQYPFLTQSGWADVKPYDAANGIFHHKYLIIDGDRPDLQPWIFTGSYNLTNSAESSNDENLLFMQSSRIANLFLQEFLKRYLEAGGVDTIRIVRVKTPDNYSEEFILYQNYPNPFNSETIITYKIPVSTKVNLKIYNIYGREVLTLIDSTQREGTYQVRFNASCISSGIYYCNLIAAGYSMNKKIVFLK